MKPTLPVTLDLPWPPSANAMHGSRVLRSARTGRLVAARYSTAAVKGYRREVWAAAQAAGVRGLQGPLAVDVVAYPPDARRRDLDNVWKVLLDALVHAGALPDDNARAVAALSIRVSDPVRLGLLRVTFRAAAEPPT